MYAVTGVTGKVGGELARTLVAAGRPVRAVVRDAKKGQAWAAQGCEVALAEMGDASALAEAFSGAIAVFVLPPPEFDPEPGYPEARAVIHSIAEALKVASPPKGFVPVDDRSRRPAGQSAFPANAAGRGPWAASDPADRLAPRLVPGQRRLGRQLGARHGNHPQLPAADGQAIGDGRGSGRRAGGGGAHSAGLDRHTRGGAGGADPRLARRPRWRLHASPRPCRAGNASSRESWAALFRSQGMRNPNPACACSTASTRAGSTCQTAARQRSRVRPAPPR